MSKIKYRIEIWTYRDLFNLLIDHKMGQLPHQRPLKLPRNYKRKLIRSVLKGILDEDIRLGDLKSLKEHSGSEYFDELISMGIIYSIEDGQHRLAALVEVSEDDFVGDFEGRYGEFMDSEVPVRIYDTLTKRLMIDKFGSVNDGSRITGIDAIWGYDTQINNFIKGYVTDRSILSIFYPITFRSTATTERTFYGNLLKILKIYFYNSGRVTNKSTDTKLLPELIEMEVSPYYFNYFDELFKDFCRICNGLSGKNKFVVQSNIFLLLMILEKREVDLSDKEILDLYNDKIHNSSQSSIGERYEPICKIVDDYVGKNAISFVFDTSEV